MPLLRPRAENTLPVLVYGTQFQAMQGAYVRVSLTVAGSLLVVTQAWDLRTCWAILQHNRRRVQQDEQQAGGEPEQQNGHQQPLRGGDGDVVLQLEVAADEPVGAGQGKEGPRHAAAGPRTWPRSWPQVEPTCTVRVVPTQ